MEQVSNFQDETFNGSFKLEINELPPSPPETPNLPDTSAPSKKRKRVRKNFLWFSGGFHCRIADIVQKSEGKIAAQEGILQKWNYLTLDTSALNEMQLLDLQRESFDIYLCDKGISKLSFEDNKITFLAGFKKPWIQDRN